MEMKEQLYTLGLVDRSVSVPDPHPCKGLVLRQYTDMKHIALLTSRYEIP